MNLSKLFFDEMSPGSCFFLPDGAKIYKNFEIDFLRKAYTHLGYKEVITLNIYDKNLWKISGHWDKYKENIISDRKK